MNWNRIKKAVAGAGLASVLLLGPAGVFKTTAMAQDRNHDRGSEHGRDGRRDGDRNWHRDGDRGWQGHNGWRDGDRDWHRDGDRDRDRDWDRGRRGYVYTYPRPYYPYGGYYGGPYGGYYGGGYYGGGYGGSFSYWEQKGYRDGLNRGQEDARSGRYPTPNNSEHFRNGNAAYRQGFARGYQAGYGQYGGYGRY